MFMPTYFKSYLDDYLSLANDVTLWDVGGERQVEITGKDAEKFVEYITPRDVSKCQVGQCMYILLTDKDGGIVNDPVLLKLANNHYWLSIADSDVLLWCKGIASSNSFDINIIEPDVSPLALQGPKAPKVMEKVVGSWTRELKFFHFKEIEINKIPVILARSGWSGEVGYEIYLKDGKLGNQLWEIFMNAGKEYKIAPAAPNQICRIECGLLSYGSDMTLEENPYDLNFEKFVNGIVGGVIPREFISSVEAGVREAANNGVLAGYAVQGVRATLYDGSYHDVDSSEVAFKVAGSMAFQDGIRRADPALLEPVMEVEVVVPTEYVGSVVGDLNSRRGRMGGIIPRTDAQVVAADVPLSEMFGYVTALRSATQGRAVSTMQFSHYGEVPESIKKEIMEKISGGA